MNRRLFGAVSSFALLGACLAPLDLLAQQPTPAGPAPAGSASPVGPGAPKAAIPLKYKFAKGETLRWKVVHHVKVDTTVQGVTQTAETHSESIKRWDVSDLMPNGDAQITYSIEKVEMWQDLQGRARVSYNSEVDEEAPEGFADVKKSIGIPLTVMQLRSSGKIASREVKHKGPGATGDDQDHQVTAPLPMEGAAVGDAWLLDVPLVVDNGNGQQRGFKAKDRFALSKITGNIATIEFETILPPVNEPAVEAMLIQNSGSGELQFDVRTGRVIKTERKVDKAVVGFRGHASRIHFISTFSETLIPTTVAQRPTTMR